MVNKYHKGKRAKKGHSQAMIQAKVDKLKNTRFVGPQDSPADKRKRAM